MSEDKPDAVIRRLSCFVKFIEEECDTFEDPLFRGQAQDWPLLPKIARLKLRDGISVLEAEQKMMSSFKNRAIPLLDCQPSSEWDWLSLAQHHGMATRLLDWSTNPLAALWFAVEKPAEPGKDGVIWVFWPTPEDFVAQPEPSNLYTSGRTRVFRPKHIAKRIVAQHGVFTVHVVSTKLKRFVPLERNRIYKPRLRRLQVPAGSFADLRYDLDRCGINAATLFVNLEGLCRDLEWQHSLLEDEAERG